MTANILSQPSFDLSGRKKPDLPSVTNRITKAPIASSVEATPTRRKMGRFKPAFFRIGPIAP
jgi:hypothetical protein